MAVSYEDFKKQVLLDEVKKQEEKGVTGQAALTRAAETVQSDDFHMSDNYIRQVADEAAANQQDNIYYQSSSSEPRNRVFDNPILNAVQNRTGLEQRPLTSKLLSMAQQAAENQAAQEKRADEWKNQSIGRKILDVLKTTGKGTGAGILKDMAGYEAALAGEGTLANDTYALIRSMLDKDDGVSAWDAFNAYGDLFIQRGGGVIPGALEELYNEVGYGLGKLGIDIDTENDIFSRWKNMLQEKEDAAEKAFYDKVGEVENVYTAGRNYRADKLAEIDQKAEVDFAKSPAAQNFYKYGTMVGRQIPNVVVAATASLLNPAAGATVAGGLAAATTEGLQAYSALQNSGTFMQLLNTIDVGLGAIASNPAYWTSVQMETGSAYNEAIEAGVDPGRASAYAIGYGLLSGIIEVGGGDEELGGLEKMFPRAVRESLENGDIAKAAWAFGKTVVQEIGEEEWQGMLQNTMKGSVLGQDAPLYSTTNPNAIINPKQMLETAKDTAITTALLGAGERAIIGAAQTIQDRGTYQGNSEALIQAARNATESQKERERIAEIRQNAKERAMVKGDNTGHQLSIGEARELQQIIRKNQGETEAQKTITRSNLEGALTGTKIDNAGHTLEKGEAQALSALYDPDLNEARTFYPAGHEAYTLGYNGLSFAEAKERAELKGYLTEKQLYDAWKLGALKRVGGESKSLSAVQNEVRTNLAHYGEEAATKLAQTHDGTTKPEEFARIIDKAVFYASHGADLQTVVEEAKRGVLKAEWAQDKDLAKLTPEQIKVAQEIGQQVAEQRKADVQQRENALQAAIQKATGATTLKQVNRQLTAVRNVLTKAEADLKTAEAEMRQMQDSGAWSENEEAYQEVVRRVENLDRIIEKGKKAEADLEARRAEAQEKAPEKRKKGTITYDESVDRNNLTREQKRAVATVQALADAVNIDYVLFAGKEGQGGSYQDGMMRVNINAALNGRNIVGAVLSHELTHHLQRFAPKEYEALRDFVIEKIKAEKGERGFSRLVQDQMRLEKGVKALSYDQAVDELVANSCVTMLADSKTVTELARKNMDLAEKIADFIADFAAKIKAAFEDVDVHSDSSLFGAARAMEKYFGDLQKLWDNALKAADENYNALQGEIVQSEEEQAMAWNGPEPERTQYGFKLMNVDEDGLPHAMFVDAAKPYELGKWYAAEAPGLDAMLQQEPGYVYLMDEDNNVLDRRPISRRPKGGIKGLPSKSAVNQATKEGRRWMTVTLDAKGKKAVATVGINGSDAVSTFALRPGLHAVDIPSMDHIGAKTEGSDVIDTRRPNQRWFLIEYPVDQDYNQEAYSNPRKDIRDHLPTRGWYSFQTNSGAEANQHWFITGGMRIVGAVSEADARKYARDHGFKEDLPWKRGKSYSDDDAMDLAEYIRTTKAQPTPSKEEMRQRITGETQFMSWDGEEDYRESLKDYSEDELVRLSIDLQYKANQARTQLHEMKPQDEEWAKKLDEKKATVDEYAKWLKESGYDDLYRQEKELSQKLKVVRELADEKQALRTNREEQEAIEKSGLSEEDYFRKQAVKEFGYTPYFYDAGYLLPNGKMLNFSGEKGRHFGSRGEDHRGIGRIFANTQGSAAMIRFINQGNIRLMPEAPGLDISAEHEPTAQQYSQIRAFARNAADEEYFLVDFDNQDGYPKASLEYEGTVRPERIVNDIKYYYQTGEVRDQGVGAWFMTWEDQMTMDDLSEGEFSAKAGSEEALVEGLTNQVKKLLVGYTPDGWDGPITAEEIDDWMEPNYYRRRTENLFSDSMQVMDVLYENAVGVPKKEREQIFRLMEQIANTMNPLLQQHYTELNDEGESRATAFSEYWDKRHPSLYYPEYEPGDLFLRKVPKAIGTRTNYRGLPTAVRDTADSLYEAQAEARQNLRREIDYLTEIIDSPDVSPETKAEASAMRDRLNSGPKTWQTVDETIPKDIDAKQLRDYEEVFYMSWDNDHNYWAPEFYSKLNNTVVEWTNEKGRPMPEKMAAGAVIPWLRGRGVKAEEIRWSGLQPWLEGKKSVMKDELIAYLSGNMVNIETEVLKTKGENQYFVGGTEGPGAYFDSMEQALEHCRQTAKNSFGDKVEVNPVKRGEQTHVRVEDGGRILAVYYIDSPENVYPDPGDTHWFDEKMDGGTNYREILFRLPGSNYHNQAMRLHWNRSGILAHARVQDMEEVSNGKMVLFVEEMQSDWHNAGAKKDKKTGKSAGFSSGENNAIYDRLAGLNEELRTVGNEAPEYTEVAKFVATLRKRILDEENLRKYWYGLPEYQLKNWIEKPGEDILDSFFRSDDYEADNREAEKLVMGLLSEEETAFIENCRYAYQRTKELRAEETKLLTEAGDTPPDAPFAGSADTYHEYVMKHLLRLAAEGDYDSIAWTTAEQQVKRWPDPDLERRIRNFKAYQIEYDQTIPSFMKKYTKQWGGKVSDMALAVPYTRGQETRVWSVDITPEMKKAVLHEGQPMFMSWEGTEDTDAEWEARLEAYSRLASEQAIQDEVFGSIRELTRSEKRSLKEIQDRLKIGKTPEARIDDAQKAARDLIRKYSSKLSEDEVTGELLHIWNYVLNEQDPSGTVARNMASELAEKIADSAKVTVEDETESDTLKEIRGRIQGAKLVISADETGDIPGYQNLTEFRKKNFGRFTVAGKNSGKVTTEHTAVDSLYEELRNDYGDYYFPEMTNQGEMLGVLAGYFDATEQQTVNPFEGNFGEAVESIANEIVRSAWWDALRLQPLSETEKVQVRNADARERLQELNAQRKITKKDVGLLEAPIEGEEQQMALNEQLKAQVRALVDAGELSKAEAADLQAKLLRMNSRVKALEDQYDLLEEQAEKRVAQAREEGAAKAAEQIAKIRERNAKNVQALKDHFQEVQKNARDRREESGNVRKYRDQVTEKAQKLYELLIKNDDKKHVPEVLKAPLAEFLEELDFTSKRQLRGGPETKKDQAFAARLMQLERMLSNQQRYIDGDQTVQSDLGGYIDISPDNLEYLRNMAEAVNRALTRGQTYTINDMSGAQLKDLSKLLSNLYTAINKMNRFMANARYDTIRDAASGDIDYLDSLGEAKDTAEGFLNRFLYWKDGVPYYVFNRFGEGGKSIFDGFTRGWEKLAFHAQEIINFTEALYTDKEVAEWTKDLHEFTLQDGSKIRMTTAQVMELSMLLNREQARKHIFKGGVRIGTVRYKEKGKTLTRNDTNHYHLTQADIENLVGSLTARQAEVARGLQRFMAEKGEEWGNEISMRRFGYNFYTEGANYYPIKTDPSDRPMSDTDTPQNASMFRLLNLSSSKALNPKASNALIIGDIFDTFANHTSDMAKLNAMGLPVLDAIKWFNYKERVNIDSFTGEHTTRTVQRAMERAYGKQAGHYFRTLMKDINGVVEAGDRGADIWSNLTARYKAVAVGANLRVALLQPTSYLRALNVIDGKYLAAAFAHRNAYKEAMENSGTAVWKSMGYYDTDISKGMRGQIKHDDSWKDKAVEASMKMAEIGDKRTWGRLWVACKLQAKAQNPGLQGEELKTATADLFRKVIYSSQVMDSTLTRSEMMRSKSIGDKLLTPFMAEPTLSFNILMDAYSGYTLDERRLGKAEAWKKNAGKIGRAFTAYVATAAFNALAESIWDAVRDDDDEEFWEKFRQALFGEDNILDGNLVSDLLISNKIPGVKDVISLLQGYGSGNIATEGITNLVNVFNMWKETYLLSTGALEKATKLTYYGRMTEWGKIYKSLQAISQLSGLPIYSATREAVAIWNTLMNGRKDEWKILTYDGNQLSDSALEGYETYVRDTGISQKQYKKIMGDADADGTVNPKQDELGEYLLAALADGAITEEQAAALWNSRGWSDKHDFNWWREKNADIEKVEEQLGMTVEESIQQAEEKLKAEATPAPEKDQLPEPTPEPTPTPTPSATPKAEKPKTEVKVDKVADYEGFKKAVPLYKEEQRKASYEVWERSLKGTLPLERYVEILQKADTDNNDSLKQEELGWALVDAVKNNDMNQDQAGEVWAAQGWSAKHDFQWWLQKNYS